MTFAILFVSIVILACLVGNRISNRIGVPMLLIFIVLGMFFGSDGVIRISFENFELAEQICSIALIFIMFYVALEQNGVLQNQLLCARLFYRLPVLFLRRG